jgi:hypothetical protein
MACIIKKITLLSAALMILAVPAFAEEGAMANRFEQGQNPAKDECLLVSMNCPNQVDTIQQRIDRIKGEISKGTNVYTNDELRRLSNELEEANKILEYESVGG